MTETTLFHSSDIELLRGQRRTLLFERAKIPANNHVLAQVYNRKIILINKQLYQLTQDPIYK